MQNYELRCRKLSGEYMAAQLGEYPSLIEALDDLADVCIFDVESDQVLVTPLPAACREWMVISADGMEMAAKRHV